MSQQLRILLVTNSVPLPSTDFLKYKLFGLSKMFDVHLLCWDTIQNRDTFYRQFSNKIQLGKIHLLNRTNNAALLLALKNIGRCVSSPVVSTKLIRKLVALYGWDYKKLFHKFSFYYPLLKLKPDIVHFEYGTLAKSFSEIKDIVSCKVLVSFRGYDLNYVGLEDEQYYSDVWKTFDGFHFLGQDLKRRAVKRGYTGDKPEVLIAPAIDTTFFAPVERVKRSDKLIILSIGRLAWKKGYEYGIQAVAKLKQKGIPFEYRIIADGNYKQPVQFTIAELGLEDGVVLSGGKTPEEIKEELAQAHVLLHPAISEGFSNAVLEAQAMGVPVIATNADGLAENIKDGTTGFIVPVWDVQTMADKLEWCSKNMDQLEEMGKAGVERVKHHFRIEEQIEKFEAFYRKVSRNGA